MRFLLPTTLTALISPLLAQTITPAPTPTSTGAWYETGPPWASDDPAKWSSIYSSLLSDAKIPSTLTAAPWPTGSWGPGQGPWGGPGFGPGHSPGGGPGRHWGGPDGVGPWGSSNYGPYSDWATRSDWRSGPWTAWWGGSKCPPSEWPGWTAGPWSTSAPWTSWEGCTASTTATSVVTATVSGVVATSTAYGLEVAAASAEPQEQQGAGGKVQVGVGAVIGVAGLVGVVVGL
ncbi:hypothetical protein GGP41_007070 [Bipolaris sorokiniana]|uniref:Uncharacterized protein n=1 Tax=Cochliobolus sativus TaxID=45130 RepID=A0A8H6E156_COCSA|nr:hypothetical protein GGP41_007070 [Bipolaris sorokiniana]